MTCHACAREYDALVLQSRETPAFCVDCARTRATDRICLVNDGGNHRYLLYSEVQRAAAEGDSACAAFLAAEPA